MTVMNDVTFLFIKESKIMKGWGTVEEVTGSKDCRSQQGWKIVRFGELDEVTQKEVGYWPESRMYEIEIVYIYNCK